MNDARDRVINYLTGLSYSERKAIMDEVGKHDSIKSKDNFEKNRKSYLRQVERHRILGEHMKEVVKPGDIVKCRGTNDRQGYREVMETTEYGIEARKLERQVSINRNGPNKIVYVRAGYITSHSWDKVAKIFNPAEIQIEK